MGGRGSGSGQKLPVTVSLVTSGMLSIPDPDHDFYVDFIVTNIGTETLRLPIFVDMAKLEPNDPKSAYSYRHLALIVISGTQHDTVLQGGTNLYGNEQLAGSLLSLDPQQSIRVHAKAKLRATDGSDQVKVQSIVGRVLLSTDRVRLSSGKLSEDEDEIGFADSQPVLLFVTPRTDNLYMFRSVIRNGGFYKRPAPLDKNEGVVYVHDPGRA